MFFGYNRRYSVTLMLSELNLPSFDNLYMSCVHRFYASCSACNNTLLSNLISLQLLTYQSCYSIKVKWLLLPLLPRSFSSRLAVSGQALYYLVLSCGCSFQNIQQTRFTLISHYSVLFCLFSCYSLIWTLLSELKNLID